MNYRLTIQYDGTDFAGWQVQRRGERTVQGELEGALSLLDGRAVTVHGAGRTDAGVHAQEQVASVELVREFRPDRLCDAVNGNVGPDVRVVRAEVAPPDFHARFSARGKTYVYGVFNERFASPFLARYTHHERRPLDLERMRWCARRFLGKHDWTAFSAAQSDVRDRVRTLTQLRVEKVWTEQGRGHLFEFTVSADGFLRFMVRSIVGTLLAAGRGEIEEETVERALETGDRALAGPTAPARGLVLALVHYDS